MVKSMTFQLSQHEEKTASTNRSQEQCDVSTTSWDRNGSWCSLSCHRLCQVLSLQLSHLTSVLWRHTKLASGHGTRKWQSHTSKPAWLPCTSLFCIKGPRLLEEGQCLSQMAWAQMGTGWSFKRNGINMLCTYAHTCAHTEAYSRGITESLLAQAGAHLRKPLHDYAWPGHV